MLEKRFGPRCFDDEGDQVGYFWGIIETRPYMRVLQAQVQFYFDNKQYDRSACVFSHPALCRFFVEPLPRPAPLCWKPSGSAQGITWVRDLALDPSFCTPRALPMLSIWRTAGFSRKRCKQVNHLLGAALFSLPIRWRPRIRFF